MQKILNIQTNGEIDDRGLIDIFLPEGKGPFKFVLGVHGGGWHNGNRKSYIRLQNRILKPTGYAIVLCSYRLRQEAKYPAAYNDLVHLLKWLNNNGADYKLDTSACVLLGGSAGGHLVALLNTKATKEENNIIEITGTVSYCPILDMKLQYEFDVKRKSSMVVNFLGGTPEEKPDLYKDASPINHIHKDMPPIWLTHGDADKTVAIENSRSFVRKTKETGANYQYAESPGEGHTMVEKVDINDNIPENNRKMVFEEDMLAFIKECMED